MAKTHPVITVLGGGTGSFTVLQALKTITPHIRAVVNMSDDGGSTGVLRDELGVLPPGDARQCLIALSESQDIRSLFEYRFDSGTLAGQSLGNMILSGLELQHGSFEKAVEVASDILRIRGKVIPVVLGNHKLTMTDGDKEITGQFAIRNHPIGNQNARVRLEPVSTINKKAADCIKESDIVVIAPGGLYYSLLPIFSVNGIKEALANTKATVVYIANLVNQAEHTQNWHVADYVCKIEEYVGAGTIDTVLYNDTPISEALLKKYAAEGEYPVDTSPAKFTGVGYKTMGVPLVSSTIHIQDKADKAIRRTLIRHDGDKVRETIEKLLLS
ncbi:MAG: gluconeogenesis factor YvcK family protein [Candidatus Saccharimonadales bacterium]